MSSKKILFVAPRFHTNQFFLTKGLLERDFKVFFLSVYIGASENHKYLTPTISKPSRIVQWIMKNKNPKYVKDRLFLRKYHITSFKQMFRIFKNINPDIIVVRNFSYLFSMQHILIGWIMGKKVFYYTLNNYRQNISFHRKLFLRILQVMGITHFTAVLGDKNKPKIPNTLYIPMIMEKIARKKDVEGRKNNEGIRIMTVGKMMERKNLRELIISLQRIGFFNDLKNTLVLASECISEKQQAYYDSIKAIINKENERQILFNINIPHNKVLSLLLSSDLFIMPSNKEPAGTALLEAMACGLPVICSDSNGSKGYIEEGVNGYIFKFNKELTNLDLILEQCLKKSELIKFGCASLERVENYHNVENFFKKVLNSSP